MMVVDIWQGRCDDGIAVDNRDRLTEGDRHMRITIPHYALDEMGPAFDDTAPDSPDAHYRALVPVVDAIRSTPHTSRGVTIDVTGDTALRALWNETVFRAGEFAGLADIEYGAERSTLLRRSAAMCKLALKIQAEIAR